MDEEKQDLFGYKEFQFLNSMKQTTLGGFGQLNCHKIQEIQIKRCFASDDAGGNVLRIFMLARLNKDIKNWRQRR